MIDEREATDRVRMFTHNYNRAIARGQSFPAIGQAIYESQADHDSCNPESIGLRYESVNQVANKVCADLSVAGIPAYPVTVRYDAFLLWIGDQPVGSYARSAYIAFLAKRRHLKVS